MRWNFQQWAQVFFSDKSRFTLRHNDGRLRVRRCHGKRFIDATVQEKVTFGGCSIMVLGAFSLHHRSSLYLINGNVSAVRYRDEILTRFAVPLLRQMRPQAVYQVDNAQPQRARVVDAYL